MSEQTITMKMRGSPVTSEEAAIAVQRLINSHFHINDGARVRIPVSAMDDDVVAADYVQESAERIAQVEAERDRLKAALEAVQECFGRTGSWPPSITGKVRAALAPDAQKGPNA